MLKYKIKVLEELKEAGYTTTRLRKEKLISENQIQEFRTGKVVGIKTLNTLCRLLDAQPGNIIKYVEDPEEEKQ
jgi:putative transcriptional regulator